MSKGVELTEKELKEVSGGAYIKDGYVYFYSEGKNWKAKILEDEDAIKKIVEQGLPEEQTAAILFLKSLYGNFLAMPEEC